MNKYIIKSEGVWNNPCITSNTIGDCDGYKPLYEGGCFAIIPHNNMFILFGEDDDHYWEEETITKDELLDLQKIYSSLVDDIKVTIDYVEAISTSKYILPKESFFSKNRSLGKWEVSVVDRGDLVAPLVHINKDSFDVSHATDRLKVINDVLNNLI
jgi:hypothetical protein